MSNEMMRWQHALKQRIKPLLFSDTVLPRRIKFGAARGCRLFINRRDGLQVEFGLYESELVSIYRRYARGVVFDVGAAEGLTALAFAKSAQHVYAFEPDGSAQSRFVRNMGLNPKLSCRIELIREGVGQRQIDDRLPRPDFIKIDVDGAELAVLNILHPFLERSSAPVVLIETHSSDLESECSGIFESIGYRTRVIHNARWRRLYPEYRPIEFNRWLLCTPPSMGEHPVASRVNLGALGVEVTTDLCNSVKLAAKNYLPKPVYRKYRQLRVRRLISGYESRVVEHSYAGRLRRISIEDPLAEGWYDHDWGEPVELTVLRRHGLELGATAFDLGAHQCVVALMVSDIVGPAGRVIAVEAECHNAAVGRMNLFLNGCANVEVVLSAVADATGHVFFAEGLNGHVEAGHSLGKARVAATTIDELATKYGEPDVVIIDIEGYEGRALVGATNTLGRGVAFMIELHVGCGLEESGSSADAVIAALLKYDYRLYFGLPSERGSGWLPLDHVPAERGFLLAVRGDDREPLAIRPRDSRPIRTCDSGESNTPPC